MRINATALPTQSTTPLKPRSGVLALSGYGLRVAVERKQLLCTDGFGRARRQGTLARATCGLSRLVVLGHTGQISFEALRWLQDVGAAFVQIDADGTLIAVSAPTKLDDARLRRSQALAPFNGTGIGIARELLHRKLSGQLRVAARFAETDEACSVIQKAIDGLSVAHELERLRLLEAAAAGAYWSTWATVRVNFARKDESRVPEHWRTFGRRSSPLTGTPRQAANPANALLNYCYAILEAECRIASLTIGLDPGMGVLHADQPSRDSLALDLMEAVRPDVDADVLTMLAQRMFGARDFVETRAGVCRVLPPLTQALAEFAPRWRALVAPVGERVAQTLADTPIEVGASDTRRTTRVRPTTRSPLPTLLTQAARSAGRDATRRKPKRTALPAAPPRVSACRLCGIVLADSGRLCCDDCLPELRGELLESFSRAGPAALARLRAVGRDPAHGADAARRRGASTSQHRREVAEWNALHTDVPDDETFRRDILPTLQGISLKAMMRATGLSLRYCSVIRRGLRVPHPRHWELLAALGEAQTS